MLKKVFSLLFLLALFLRPGIARAEEIVSFDVTAKILEDSRVTVSEKIQYDFGAVDRHGIFRNIPFNNDSFFKRLPLSFSNVSVVDEKNQAVIFNISKTRSDLVIKIGDPDKTVTGVNTYIINYTVNNAIKFFDAKDQFYWNITGNHWQVPMRAASASIFFPSKTGLQNVNLFCYAGPTGSTDLCQEARLANPVYVSQFNLSSQSGITVRLDLPKGVIYQPSLAQVLLNFLQNNKIFLLPIITFFLLLLIWIKFGRDQKGAGVIVAQFDAPDNLTPAEVGAIFDQRVDNKDISAEIISLAIRGYIKINQVEKKKSFLLAKDDYEFTLLKAPETVGNDHDKKLLRALFMDMEKQSVLLSSLKNNTVVYAWIKGSKKLLYKGLATKGYFKFNPDTVRQLYASIGTGIIFVVVLFSLDAALTIALIISTMFIVFFGLLMPALTKKGALTREYILGLKKYLEVAEKTRLDFHNAPEKKPETFEKLLPFAMVLGVEKKWAQQFEDMHLSSPSWYSSYHGGSFSAIAFTSTLGSFSSNLSSAGVSGGGSSGGGGGGGGGGSW